jgi:hypothetical protein
MKISDADVIYAGSNAADKVYQGANELWSGLLAETLAYQSRVLADGGVIANIYDVFISTSLLSSEHRGLVEDEVNRKYAIY